MKLSVMLLIILFYFSTRAQNPIFTQHTLIPETINPGFTGILETTTFGILHRSQKSDLNFSMETDFVHAGFWLEKVKSGLGFIALHHRENGSNFTFTQLNAIYMYRVKLSNNWHFRPALEIGAGYKSFGFGNLIFEDQIDIGNETINPISTDPNRHPNRNVFFTDFSAGALFSNKTIWAGFTIRHLNKPNISIAENGNVLMEMLFSANVGYRFLLTDNIDSSRQSELLLTSNFITQDKYSRLDIGTTIIFRKLFFGVSSTTNPLQNNDNLQFIKSINAITGFQYQHFRFGISHDIQLSKLGKRSGIYELSLSYQLDLDVNCMSCPKAIH